MGLAGIVGLLVVAWAIFTFNRLIRLRQLGDNAWSDIDVQLKRRHDLIPNVVAVVQGHAGYEKGTLEAVVAARGRALQASQAGPATRAREEDPLGNALQRVVAVAEAYPELKAAASFASLQSTLIDVEEHLQNARRYYNAVVRDFNIAIAQFPAGIIAGMMRLQPREFFGLDDPSERAVPKVPVVLLFLALSGTGLSAQRSYSIERFDARIRVNRDASIDVTETITARFVGSYNGLYRTIPVVYHGAQGLNWTIRLMLQSARDNAGHDLRTETSQEGASVKYKIWIPGATNADRTIVLRYHATNALRFFDEHDELYWNVTGDQWDVPIRRASAEIELPRGAPGGRPEIEVAAGAPGVRAIAYNGVYGSTARDAKVTISDTVIRVAMPHRLDFHEGLTAVVGWDKGLVTRPTAMDRAMEVAGSNWPFLIPIPVFLIAFMRWSRRGRDPRRRPVTVLYEPPAGITPAEAGTLIDHSVDMRDITATLLDLAVRGYIRIEEQENPKLLGLFGGGTDYTLHRLKSSEGLKPHELAVFNGVFGKDDVFGSFSASSTMSLSVSVDGKEIPLKTDPAKISPPSTGGGTTRQRVPLEELNQRFYQHLNPIRNAIWDQLIDSGFYRKRPEKARHDAMRLGCALPLVIAIAGSLLSPLFLLTPVPFILAALVSAVILYIFAQLMPSRTEPGTRALEQVLGFEEFLRRVDSEHTQAIVGHPELFDKCLPYAMAFGVDQQFARAFEGIYKEPPGWYVGPSVTDFNVRNLSRRVTHLETFLRTTMTSTPRSVGTTWYSSGASGGGSSSSPSWSFGSGFGGGGKSGGGGFSGGGGGGGGGGAF